MKRPEISASYKETSAPPNSSKKRKSTSDVWNHFIKETDQKAKCKHCGKHFSGSSKDGTTHLKNHLNSSKCKRSQKETGGLENPTVTNGNFVFDEERSCLDLVRMIIKDGYLLNMVEHECFKILMKNLQPAFKLPSQDTLKDKILCFYREEKEILRRQFDKVSSFSLILNFWTDCGKKSKYCSFTLQFIEDGPKLMKKNIAIKNVEYNYTAETLFEIVKGVLLEWNVGKKLATITVEGSCANDQMVKMLDGWLGDQGNCHPLRKKIFHVPCITDAMNLLLEGALDRMDIILLEIRRAIKRMSETKLGKQKFEEVVKKLNLGGKDITSEGVPVRWDSTFFMLQIALEFRRQGKAFVDDEEECDVLGVHLSEEEWDEAKAGHKCLTVLYDAICSFFGSKCLGTNVYFRKISDISKSLTQWIKSDIASAMVINLCLTDSRILYVSTIVAVFDPRTKLDLVKYAFEQYRDGSSENWRKPSVDLGDMFNLYAEYLTSQRSSSSFINNDNSSSSDGDDPCNILEDWKKWKSQRTELEKYLQEPLQPDEDEEFDILGWWHNKSQDSPTLSMMARDILAIPMSTSTSNSAFCIETATLDPIFNDLDPDIIEALFCGRDWLDNPIRITPNKDNDHSIANPEPMLENPGSTSGPEPLQTGDTLYVWSGTLEPQEKHDLSNADAELMLANCSATSCPEPIPLPTKMADLVFNFEIHHGGQFVRNPDLIYLGGSTSFVNNVDPDRLSYFKIQDICCDVGALSTSRYHYLIPGGNLEQGLRLINEDDNVVHMCKIHAAWPTDKITLYVEGGEEPLAVEQPFGNKEVANDDDDVHEVGESDDDVHDVREGGNVDAEGGDINCLEEGFEGPDFDNDVFGNVDDGPSTHAAPHRPSEGDDGPSTHEDVHVYAAPHRNTVADNDPPLEDGEWIDPPLEDDMESLVGSDNDQPAPAAKEPEFNVQTDMRKPELRKGMKFPNSKVFREALREYAIKKPVNIKFKLNEKKKISVYCINECGWRCYASQLPEELTFQIKTFNPECTCPRSFKHSQVTSTYVAKKFMQEFDKNPNWKVAGVQHYVKQALEVDISYSQVYRAKRKATDLVTGDEQLQYGKLRDYAEMIRLNDKGSRVILQTEMEDENAQPKFKRMYIRYNAQKLGFLGGCRLIIGLDGCHLKGRFGGQILSAIARDANDNIFPVAFAVVEQENKDSWVWFLQQFSDDIGDPEQLNLVFISDRQKGLIPAIEMLFPTCEHRYCVKHIYNNFKVDHKGLELKDALWRCAGATTVREFERRMQEMKDLDVKAWEYLTNINPAQWSKSHFSSRALCDCLANNLSESFNAMILEARDKPILAMLEWIRVRLMTKQYKKMRGIAKYTGKVCPNIQDKLEKLKHESISFSATPAGSFMYEVDNGRERHVVDLAKKACSCRIWDLTGLPCKHGISAIVKNLEKVEDYVHSCYLKETFAKTYKEIIQPMPGQSEWVKTNQPAPVAPHVYKPLGRPPKQRKRDPEELRNSYRVSRMNKTIKCGKCKKEGHNARGCKAGITGETPWQRRDRLAKSAAAQGSKSTKTKQTATPQTASQPPSTRSQSAYRAFGQTASQPAPNNRFDAATQPATRSKPSASARGFKGRKFQPVGGKGKNTAGKGT